MAVDRSDLMKLPKEDLADGFTRMAGRVKKVKEKAKEAAEDIMGLALAGGAAFGVGYWIGNIKGGHAVDGTDPTEDLKLFGMDKDLVVGIGLAALGLTGMGGKRMSGAAKAAGTGVLSYWAGSAGERMAIERATEPEDA
jgi:hypothetical protein